MGAVRSSFGSGSMQRLPGRVSSLLCYPASRHRHPVVKPDSDINSELYHCDMAYVAQVASSYFLPVPLACFAAALLARAVNVLDLTWPPESRAALDSMRAAASIVMGRVDAGVLVDCMVVPIKSGNESCRIRQRLSLYSGRAPSAAAPMVLKS